jgi:hypothetical protein
MTDSFTETPIRQLNINRHLRKKLEIATEALKAIAEHNTLGGDKYNNYGDAYYGVVDFAEKALEKLKK